MHFVAQVRGELLQLRLKCTSVVTILTYVSITMYLHIISCADKFKRDLRADVTRFVKFHPHGPS